MQLEANQQQILAKLFFLTGSLWLALMRIPVVAAVEAVYGGRGRGRRGHGGRAGERRRPGG